MRSLLAATMIMLVALCVMGCAGGSSHAPSTSHASGPGVPRPLKATVAFGITHRIGGLKGDEDDDDEPDESKSEGSNPEGDADNDTDNDYLDSLHKGYYDRDDSAIVDFGHAASAAEERALATVVKRYVEAAAVADGGTACTLLASSIADTAAEDYGRNAGPSYLSGANTCPQLLTDLFRHAHAELTAAVEMTGARIEGNQAYALLGSAKAPASSLSLLRGKGAWKVDELLVRPLT
jgi:hypothetical protein